MKPKKLVSPFPGGIFSGSKGRIFFHLEKGDLAAKVFFWAGE